MSSHWITTLPLSGIVYGLVGAVCVVWAICRKADTILLSLGGVIISIAILNAYSEEWLVFKQFRFESIVPFLMVLFLLPYRSLCLRLIERTGLRASIPKEIYSFLPLVYVGFAAMTIISPAIAKQENPPLALFMFMVFVCAVHVPTIAAGRSKVEKFVAESGIVSETSPYAPRPSFTTAMVATGTPLVLSLIVHATLIDEWRLFAVDTALTAIILSLFTIFRRQEINAGSARF